MIGTPPTMKGELPANDATIPVSVSPYAWRHASVPRLLKEAP